MYTQCESIHCRSVAPLQDTPAVKQTYTVHVETPKEIVVRISGNLTKEETSGSNKITEFSMKIPVAPYLLAIIAGNLQEQQLGKRTYVITEPEMMEKSASDLEDLEETMRINKGIIKNLVEASNLPTASTRMIDSLEKESDALRA